MSAQVIEDIRLNRSARQRPWVDQSGDTITAGAFADLFAFAHDKRCYVMRGGVPQNDLRRRVGGRVYTIGRATAEERRALNRITWRAFRSAPLRTLASLKDGERLMVVRRQVDNLDGIRAGVGLCWVTAEG